MENGFAKKEGASSALFFLLVYAALAGLRTISDFDVWWQLASGREFLATGHLPRVDVFSYTAAGAPWTYPAGAGVVFYAVFRMGGYAILSLLAPLAMLSIAGILLWRGGIARSFVLVLAIPLIAGRTMVRAEMFTAVLATVFLVLLWDDVQPAVWSLPALMLAWVNLHPGFVIGIGLVTLFWLRSPKKLARLALATFLASLVNPWGWRIYQAVWNQAAALAYQKSFIGEWLGVPISWPSISDALRLTDPDGAYWRVMAVSLIAVAVGLRMGKAWGAILLAGAMAVSLNSYRLHGLFGIAATVIAADLLGPLEFEDRPYVRAGVIAVLGLFVVLSIPGLVTNSYYLSHGEISSSGIGVSAWFPERAVQFVEQNHLPREIYHDYNLGGYLTWRLHPKYPVFIDGRALPYGPGLFFAQQRLARLGPDSADWRQALDRWKIRTLLVSTARFGGYGALPLKSFCASPDFDLVYIDETAAVFVKAGETSLARLDCRTAKLPLSTGYDALANAGKLYYALERDDEAAAAWKQAGEIFNDDPSLHLDLGQLAHARGQLEIAERQFRMAISMRPTATSWFALGDLLAGQNRHAEAAECFLQSAARNPLPHEAYRALAESYLAMGRPREALDAADRALARNPFVGPAEVLGRGFTSRVLALRGLAIKQIDGSSRELVK